jgi:hypothetical protein
MKTHHTILILCALLAATVLNTARAEIPPLSNNELQKSPYTYRGQVTKIEWAQRASIGCIASVKEAKVHLRLNQIGKKQIMMPVIVKGHINVLGKDGCVGPSGNWDLQKLKVGDRVIVYGEKSGAGALVEIRQPNGLSIQK